MIATLNPWRSAALGGVLATLAYAVWLFPLLTPGPIPPDLTLPMRALVWVQALALIVLLPATLAGRAGPGPTLLLASIPWPLLTLFDRVGGLPPGAILGTQGLILALALALWVLGRGADLAPAAWRWPLVGGIQGAAALALVAGFGVWAP